MDEAPNNTMAEDTGSQQQQMSIQENTPNLTVQMTTGEGNGMSIMAPEGDPEGNPVDNTEEQQTANQGNPQQTEALKATETLKATEALKNDVTKHTEALKALEKDLRNKGVDFKQAVKEYQESGDISSRTLANLVNAGYPKEVIQSFIDGQKAIEERFTNAVYDTAGGEQEYFKLTQWAAQNLPESSVRAFNKALDSNDIDLISLMVQGIRSKMVATRGTSNPTIMGGSGGNASSASKGFASKQEMIQAMSDPKYGRDPAYTRSVEQKMYFTNF